MLIKPEEIRVGDTIRVSLTFNGDMKITREGTVKRVGGNGKVVSTGRYAVLLDTCAGMSNYQSDVVVELLDRPLTLPCEVQWSEVMVDDKVQLDFSDGSLSGRVVEAGFYSGVVYVGGMDIEITPQDIQKITLLEREEV